MSFRVGGPGGSGGGDVTAFKEGSGLLAGDSTEGDQGMAGSALVMLLNDSVFPATSFSSGLVISREQLVNHVGSRRVGPCTFGLCRVVIVEIDIIQV